MAKRMILMLTTMAVLISVLGFVKFREVQTAMAEGAAFQPPPESVTTVVAREETWSVTHRAVGTVAAVQGVTIGADLPGTIERIAFESGQAVRAGQVLVELNTRQELAQLAAAEADRELAQLNFDRMKELLDERVISRAEFDRAMTERKATEARAGEIRAAIARKTVRAPFSGILGIRQVNLGQYLREGEAVVDLQALDPIHVNFGVPQQTVGEVGVGREVRIGTDADGPALTGRVTALDAIVDEATRNVQVQATLENRARVLRPGMFVEVEVMVGTSRPVIALPASAISYAPFGDSVFIVTDLEGPDGQTYRGVRQQFVKLGGSRGDQIAVVAGIEPDDEVVTSGVFKLRTGVAVLVNNTVQPANDPTARPEER